jgi:hypothetical protein
VAPAAAEDDPGAGTLELCSEKRALTNSIASFSADFVNIRKDRASAFARRGGSEGSFTVQRAVALSVIMEKARANQAAWLTCPLGSSLYPLGLALNYTPCGVRCKLPFV